MAKQEKRKKIQTRTSNQYLCRRRIDTQRFIRPKNPEKRLDPTGDDRRDRLGGTD